MFSPTIACLPWLVVFRLRGHEAFSYDTPGLPLIISWVLINTLAALLVPSLALRRVIREGCGSTERYALSYKRAEGCESDLDETDGPTFLPQQPFAAYYDIVGEYPNEGANIASTFTPRVSWEKTIETPEALDELVRWGISAPSESLRPSVTAELLAIAAISIGVRLDGMGEWDYE